jgi:hypothetical protein
MSYLKRIKVTIFEERPDDSWYDMNLRQLRNGQVNYYRAKDFLNWRVAIQTLQRQRIRKKYW